MLIPIPNDPATRRQAMIVVLIHAAQNATDETDFKRRLREAMHGVGEWARVLCEHGNGD